MERIGYWKYKCRKYKIVSFDIFDTLLVRNFICPEDVFKLVEMVGIAVLGDKARGFCEQRKKAAQRANACAGDGGASYEEIYKCLEGFSETDVEFFQKKELEIERCGLERNSKVYPLYSWCRTQNKKIIAISDMYLPSDFLNDVLQKNGILCDEVYVSCEEKCSKRTGILYRKIKEKNRVCKHDKIVHIGDSWKSDFIQAQKNGFAVLHVKKRKFYQKHSILGGMIEAHLENYKGSTYFSDLGYKVLGPILYGYCLWLYKDIKEKNIQQIFFLSRDGKIMKQSFQAIYGDEIETEYICVSRRALGASTFWLHCSYDEVKKYVISNSLSVHKFMDRIGLELENYKSVLLDFSINPEQEYLFDDFWSNKEIERLYHAILPYAIENSIVQYMRLMKYLESFQIKEKIALVDIGWRGSMQQYFEEIFNSVAEYKNVCVRGYYIGIEKTGKQFNGYLYSGKERMELKYLIDAGVGLFETLFLAHEGTTLAYTEDETEIEPILGEYEIIDKENKENLDLMQKSALIFIERMERMSIKALGILPAEEAFLYYKKLVLYPKKCDLEKWTDFVFYDVKKYGIITKRGLKYYWKRWSIFLNDFHSSPWKIGFLKENTFRWIPWGSLYKVLKRLNLKNEK